MQPSLVLVTLLVKLGVAAAIASVLARSRYFKVLLFREPRKPSEIIHLVSFIAIPFALGVLVRVSVKNFLSGDLAMEAAILMGVIGGRAAGAAGGALVALPTLMHGEFISLPFNVGAGLLAGALRRLAADQEEIWSFSPGVDLSVYRWIRRNVLHPRLDWQISFFLMILALQFIRIHLARIFPGQIFALDPGHWWFTQVADYAVTAMAIAIPLKIWNNVRIERKLEEQERMLLLARMEALQSQINPHFLFNTLNSISSLVRFDPDMARELIIKLANILRRLLRKSDAFVQLREEIEFIDNYLDIEVVRFGRDKLRVEKQLEAATLELMVPSMLLQPIVENSIKHGLAPKIDGGSIHLRSRISGENALLLEIADDGVGIATTSESQDDLPRTGIGLANVAERLKVLYGDVAKITIESSVGGGTLIRLSLPVLAGMEAERGTALAYEPSSTRR